MTHYQVLGVGPGAGAQEIKAAYRAKLLAAHPDKGGRGDADVVPLNLAYRVLSNEQSRKEYDEELNQSVQKQGFNINGDGLDVYGLEDFEEVEQNDSVCWYRACPRCTADRSMTLTEDDLENHGSDDGMGGYDIVVQCESCSLWITVKYYEAT